MNKLLKVLSVAILFLFSLTSVEAQNQLENVSLTYGEELPDDSQKIVKIIGEANNKIYALAIKKKKFFLKIFESGSMKQVASNRIELPNMKKKDVDFEDIFLINGNIYAIGSVYDRKAKQFKLLGASVSESGIVNKNGTILFESKVAKKKYKGSFS
ncbi:MAG: hypothetical protein BM557_03350 [Flavobacterium sp. MedPE-SWcel]|uniref:hypothetical protein n=1 Tax=uncultured Flavobacterium sp. TaxID=165435 RepID=UPI000912D1E7|nr:hypothetical protein [uncultured Flavobacterium sp.]OIQ21300.1 MAG: hypothetical protein BM557_03350 [Flavobacterium sp. MedPE-SWcel]